MSEIKNSRPCALRGCQSPGIVWDDKYDTKMIVDSDLLRTTGPPEYWLCQAHAEEYLWPIIDSSVGYTKEALLKDFRDEGVF